MNFVAKWCHDRCGVNGDCEKCKHICAPRFKLSEDTGLSEHLLWILQNQHGGVTHPKLADRLADYIGATSDERDSVVHKKHHGTYVPNPNNPDLPVNARKLPGATQPKCVVAIDRDGHILRTMQSILATAKHFGCAGDTVVKRCNRTAQTVDEFEMLGVSFRYHDEWDSMDDIERIRDIIAVRVQNDEKRRRAH